MPITNTGSVRHVCRLKPELRTYSYFPMITDSSFAVFFGHKFGAVIIALFKARWHLHSVSGIRGTTSPTIFFAIAAFLFRFCNDHFDA